MADPRTNLELTTVALNALKEIECRGNKRIAPARRLVSSFRSDILSVHFKIKALKTLEDSLAKL